MQIQLQRDGESNRCWFGRLIIRIVANLGEQLPINICFLIDLGILFAAVGKKDADGDTEESYPPKEKPV